MLILSSLKNPRPSIIQEIHFFFLFFLFAVSWYFSQINILFMFLDKSKTWIFLILKLTSAKIMRAALTLHIALILY